MASVSCDAPVIMGDFLRQPLLSKTPLYSIQMK